MGEILAIGATPFQITNAMHLILEWISPRREVKRTSTSNLFFKVNNGLEEAKDYTLSFNSFPVLLKHIYIYITCAKLWVFSQKFLI